MCGANHMCLLRVGNNRVSRFYCNNRWKVFHSWKSSDKLEFHLGAHMAIISQTAAKARAHAANQWHASFVSFRQMCLWYADTHKHTHTESPGDLVLFSANVKCYGLCSIYWLITDLLDKKRCVVIVRCVYVGVWDMEEASCTIFAFKCVYCSLFLHPSIIFKPIWPVFSYSYYTSLPAMSPSVTACSRGLWALSTAEWANQSGLPIQAALWHIVYTHSNTHCSLHTNMHFTRSRVTAERMEEKWPRKKDGRRDRRGKEGKRGEDEKRKDVGEGGERGRGWTWLGVCYIGHSVALPRPPAALLERWC